MSNIFWVITFTVVLTVDVARIVTGYTFSGFEIIMSLLIAVFWVIEVIALSEKLK